MDDSTKTEPLVQIEIDSAKEKDGPGLSYITSLVTLYAVFFIALIVIAWFGLFSEV